MHKTKYTWDRTENGGNSPVVCSCTVCSAASGILGQVRIGGSVISKRHIQNHE